MSWLYFVIAFVSVNSAFGQTTTISGAALYRTQCAVCHDAGGVNKAPGREVMRQMAADAVVQTLETGRMQVQGEALSLAEKRAVAVFLTGKTLGPTPTSEPLLGACSTTTAGGYVEKLFDPRKTRWQGWGVDLENTRFQPAAGLRAEDLPKLKLKWALGFPGAVNANAQPALVDGRVFVGSPGRKVYSLDAKTGCIHWVFSPQGSVRAGINVGPSKDGRTAAFIADSTATLYAVDAVAGTLLWKTKVDTQPVATITGTPQLYKNLLYIPISVPEDGAAMNPKYACCTQRGGVAAVNASTGELVWKTYAIAEAAKPTGKKNKAGVALWGPSGASIWLAPTIDIEKNVLYVGTGDNHSEPPTDTCDAILAMDLDTGRIVWKRQLEKADLFNASCVSEDKTNCPEPTGPDWDIGASPILRKLPNGKRVLLVGQKSSVVHGLDPDQNGSILWQTRLGKGGALGGIQWGIAADERTVYAPLSDIDFKDITLRPGKRLEPNPKAGGGLFALDIETGRKLWAAPAPACPPDRQNCSPAQSAAPSVIPGVIFSGSVDGHLRAYSTGDGKVLWDYDTARSFETINGVAAKGGALDAAGPAIAQGMVFVNAGYASWGGLPGNVLLAFSIEE